MTSKEYLDIYNIVGAAMEVHKVLGRGMAEPIYQEALDLELRRNGIVPEREKVLALEYKGIKMKKWYSADFYVNGVIVEIKSVERLTEDHRAQLFNYMRITKTHRGLLINFAEKSLRAERYLYNEIKDDFILLSKNNYKQHIKD